MRQSKIDTAVILLTEHDKEEKRLIESHVTEHEWHTHDCMERVVLYYFKTMSKSEIAAAIDQYDKSSVDPYKGCVGCDPEQRGHNIGCPQRTEGPF